MSSNLSQAALAAKDPRKVAAAKKQLAAIDQEKDADLASFLSAVIEAAGK